MSEIPDRMHVALDDLLWASERLLITHGCSLIISYQGEENRCADCFGLRSAIAAMRIERKTPSCE